MRKFVVAAIVAATAALPAAAVTITSVPGAPDPGPFVFEQLVVTFDAPNAAGITDSSIGAVITATGNISGVRAAPAGNTSIYRSVGTNGSSTFDFGSLTGSRGVRTISLSWGSVDSFNRVSFLDAGGNVIGSFTGNDLPAATGNQTSALTNRRVRFDLTGSDAITQVRFSSTGNAFEFDDIAVRSVVPEPQAWMMLLAGFGLVGSTLRRRNRSVAA